MSKLQDIRNTEDSRWISVKFKKSDKIGKYRKFVSRDYSKFNINNFCKNIEGRIEYRHELDIHQKMDRFVQMIQINALEELISMKEFKIPKNWDGKEFYSNDIRLAVKKMDKAYKKAIHTREVQDWQQFKTEKNTIVKLIKKREDFMKI